MKVNWRILSLITVIAVGILLFLFVFTISSEGKQNRISLPAPPGTAAVIYVNGVPHSIAAPNPAKVEQAVKESQPHWWIDAGKKISAGALVAAAFFSGLSMNAPSPPVPEPHIMALILTGKFGATGLSYICSAVAAGVGVSVIWVDAKTPKLTWEEAEFYIRSPGEQVEVLKFPDGRLALIKKEGKLIKYLLIQKFLVILRQKDSLPNHTLLDGKILYYKERPVLPSQEIKRNETQKIVSQQILVIY